MFEIVNRKINYLASIVTVVISKRKWQQAFAIFIYNTTVCVRDCELHKESAGYNAIICA